MGMPISELHVDYWRTRVNIVSFTLISGNMIVHTSESRGHANHGWLQSHHSFSFASYFNPERMNFGALRVLNDDVVLGGHGFGKHPHNNMEIISIPTAGALKHEDSMGHSQVLTSQEVQVMSAGTGLTHAEFNASEADEVRFFQIWITPRKRNTAPRYDQRAFSEMPGVQLLVSPDGEDDSLWIGQDAWISRYRMEQDQSVSLSTRRELNGLYVFMIEGAVTLNDRSLGKRDAAGISDKDPANLTSTGLSDVLVIDVPLA